MKKRVSKKVMDIMDIIEREFWVRKFTNYAGKIVYQLESWTDGGISMIIDVRQDYIIDGLKEYVDDFNINEEIAFYQKDDMYNAKFSYSESLEDFESYLKRINDVIKRIERI